MYAQLSNVQHNWPLACRLRESHPAVVHGARVVCAMEQAWVQ